MIKQRKPKLYFHQPTGNIMEADKKQAKKLGPDWHELKFTKNEKGEDVMRFTFVTPEGLVATVDVQETGEVEVENGQPVAK